MSDVVHVAYLQDNLASDYSRHTGTAMLSMLEYCSKHAIIHLFHEEILSQDNISKREEEMNKFRKMVCGYDAEIHFHNVIFPEVLNHYTEKFSSDKWSIKWNRIIFTRYFLQNLLPDVDRIIVLGSDTIVHTDVSALLESMPEKYCFGGVIINKCSKKTLVDWEKAYEHIIECGLDRSHLIIGCVHLFNLKKIREMAILPQKALSYYMENPDKVWIDDNILSLLFLGNSYYLERRFNYYAFPDDIEGVANTLDDFNNYLQNFKASPLKGYILHFPYIKKPWDKIENIYDVEYWANFYKTPWGREDKSGEILKSIIVPPKDVIYNYVWEKPFFKKIGVLSGLICSLIERYIDRYILKK